MNRTEKNKITRSSYLFFSLCRNTQLYPWFSNSKTPSSPIHVQLWFKDLSASCAEPSEGTRSFPRIHPPQKGVVFTNSLVVLMMMMYRLYWHVEPLFGSDSWYALDFLDLFLLHKTLSYSWELLRTTEMTWRWAMWLYFSSRSGRGERTFSWKPSVRFASKEISSMRTSSAMLQVSFLWMKHNHFWMFSTSASYRMNHSSRDTAFPVCGERRRTEHQKWAVAVALWKSVTFQSSRNQGCRSLLVDFQEGSLEASSENSLQVLAKPRAVGLAQTTIVPWPLSMERVSPVASPWTEAAPGVSS